jgi:acyl-CoA synthetase (AMP-forming)/AMP-acid ligase II/thioesterase domain-containing protein
MDSLRQNPSSGHKMWLQLWHKCLEEHPDQIALSTSKGAYTYAMLGDEAKAISDQLNSKLGNCTSHIITIDTDRDDFLVPFLGVWLAGGIVLPVSLKADNPTLKNTSCRKISGAFIDNKNSITIMPAESIYGTTTEERSGWHSLYLTSGTTGKPKLIVRGWRQALFEATAYINTAKLSSGQRLGACIQPTFGALTKHLLGGLLAGCHQQFFTPSQDATLPDKYFDVLMLTPSLVNALSSTIDVSAGLISLTGEPLNQLSWNNIKRIGKDTGQCLNAYGGTEFGVLANHISKTSGLLPEFSGEILSGKSVRLIDPEKVNEQPNNPVCLTEGLIQIQSPWIAEGAISETANGSISYRPFPRQPDGTACFQTLDIGVFSPENRLRILGRLSDRIKRHGRWLHTENLKSILDQTPGIDVWISEFDANAQSHIWLQVSPGYHTSEIKKSLLEALWHSPLLPRTITVVATLPTTGRGKLSRGLLNASSYVDRIHFRPWLESIAAWVAGDQSESSWIDGSRSLASIDLDSLDRLDLHLCISQIHGQELENFLLPQLTLNEIREAYDVNSLPRSASGSLPTLYWLGQIPHALLNVAAGQFLIIAYDVDKYLKPSLYNPLNNLAILARRVANDIYKAMPQNPTRSMSGACFIGGFSFGANLAHEIAIELQTLLQSDAEVHALLVDPLAKEHINGYKGISRLKHHYYKLCLRVAGLQKAIPLHILYRTIRRTLLLNHKPRVSACQSALWTSGKFRETTLPLFQRACDLPLEHYLTDTNEHLALADNPQITQAWATQLSQLILRSHRTQSVDNNVAAHSLADQ